MTLPSCSYSHKGFFIKTQRRNIYCKAFNLVFMSTYLSDAFIFSYWNCCYSCWDSEEQWLCQREEYVLKPFFPLWLCYLKPHYRKWISWCVLCFSCAEILTSTIGTTDGSNGRTVRKAKVCILAITSILSILEIAYSFLY